MSFNQNSLYLEDQILNWMKGTAFAAAPTGIWLGIMTAAPTASHSGGVEASWAGYARQQVTLGSLAGVMTLGSGDDATNSAQITFPINNSGSTVTIVSYALFDAATAGNLLMLESTAAVAIPTGSALQFTAGSIQVNQI